MLLMYECFEGGCDFSHLASMSLSRAVGGLLCLHQSMPHCVTEIIGTLVYSYQCLSCIFSHTKQLTTDADSELS